MRNAFRRELWRSISSNLARFLSIVGIVALGCGFYAGLGMSGLDMRLSADGFYDGTHLYDLRVLSTMGLTDEQVDLVRRVDGVDQVMPGYAADVMATLNGERYAMRLMSIDVQDVNGSSTDRRGVVVSSDNDAYLNRLVLDEGSWPVRPGECVLSADRVMGTPIQVGDEVEVLYGTADLDGVLEERSFVVSGLVHSSAFVSSTTLGYTNLGSGVIQQYLFVPEQAFSEDLPYTEVFVTVTGAADELSGSDGYQALVDEVAERIGALPIAQSRLDEVRGDAQAELDDATAEFEEERDDAYAQLDEAQAELDDALAKLEDARAQIVEGQAELDSGEAELADARREAAAKLADARAQLDAAQAKIDSGAAALAAGQRELDANEAQLAQGEAELAENRAKWESARPGLEEAAAGREQLVGGISQAQDGLDQLDDGISQLDGGIAELDGGISQLDEGISQLEGAISAIDELDAQIALLEAQIAGADEETAAQLLPQLEAVRAMRAQLGDRDALVAQRDALTAQREPLASQRAALIEQRDGLASQREEVAATLAGLQSQLAALDEQLAAQGVDPEDIGGYIATNDATLADAATQLADARAKLEAGKATLADQSKKLADARSQLESGRAELAAQEASAEAQLDAAERELEEGRAELADARAQLADGEREYEDGLATYRSSRAEVDERLADAAAQLAEAQADIDELELPDVYVLDRTKNSGTSSYQADSERIDAIAQVFPLIFFLVAALVSLTTMTRMVEDERVEIGTHKALGFSTAQITSKYVAYAAIAGVIGSVAGILLLSQVLPLVVMFAYAIIYNVPLPAFPLPINLPISLLAEGLGVGVTLVATAAAAAATLTEVPASLMLPRAPAPGKRILLERITPIWSRLSFSWKVTFRNLFRYKRRLAMTIIGIAGCTALLLTGLGLHDSIWDIIAKQFEGDDPITRYTVVVGTDDPSVLDEVEDELSNAGATSFARVATNNVQVASDAHPAPMAVTSYCPEDPSAFLDLVSLRDRASGEPVTFDAGSVVLTEKVATRLGVRPGDTIYVYEQDDIGNATGEGVPLTLTGVSENYIYHYLYVGGDALGQAWGSVPAPDSVLADIPDDEGARSDVAEVLSDKDEVTTVTFNTEQVDSYRKSLRSVNMVVVVLIVAAAALVFIVLYNLTNIQLIERTREIASLKVLGFDRREVAAYVFRETLLLVCLGALIGLGLGVMMEGFVVVTAEVDVVMFGRAIHAPSFAVAFALTIAFSLVVMATLLPKLRAIDMVESLKSVD